MSFSEMTFAAGARELLQSFTTTRTLLRQLLSQLEARRAAWVSVRPSVLQPSAELEQGMQELAREDDRRAGLAKRLRELLPAAAGVPQHEQHVNTTRIAAALPRAEGRALREVADDVARLARQVRTEVTLGQRLLGFARRTQAALHADLTAAGNGPTAYDHRARSVAAGNRAGRLVDGRM